MTPINGKHIDFDFSKYIKVSDLIYFDGPLLSHFISPNGDNYLFYWCDVDDLYNRWIIVRVDISIIQQYIEKKIPLKDIILSPLDGFVYVADIDNDINYQSVQILLSKELPDEYVPCDNSFFDFEIHEDMSLMGLSQKYSSGILEIHVSGRDVPYGSIPLNKFAPLLPKIDEIRKGMASKFIRHTKAGVGDRNAKEKVERELRLDTQYEYMYSLAGSIRFILKPINQQRTLAGMGTYADSFAEDFAGLFSSGFSKEDILSYSQKYDKQLIKKYNDLIKFLFQEDLSIGVNWCNAGANIKYRANVNREDTRKILANLSDFEFDSSETIEMIGRFYSLNIRSGSYSFESIEGDDAKSSGYLDEMLKDVSYGISFNKVYRITIDRKLLEPIGQKKQTKDTIVSFKEVE